MNFIADLSLIISAGAMIALAILTRRSVGVMEKTLETIRRDSALKTRPFVRIDERTFEIIGEEGLVRLRYRVLNVGGSPALIDKFEVLMNDTEIGDKRGSRDALETDLPFVAFPEVEDFYCDFYFDRINVMRENMVFRLDVKMEYSSVGYEDVRYCFTGGYELVCKETEGVGIEVKDRIVKRENTT